MAVAERQARRYRRGEDPSQVSADRQAMSRAQTRSDKIAVAQAIAERENAQFGAPTTSSQGRRVINTPATPSPELEAMAQPLREEHARQAAALRPFTSKEEAKRAAEILKANADKWDQERLDAGWARVKQYIAENPEEFRKPQSREELQALYDEEAEQAIAEAQGFGAFADQYFRQLTGLGSAAASVVNSAIAEPIVGIGGATNLLFGGTNEEANDLMDSWRDSLTFVPVTQRGEEMLQTVAEPISKLDEFAKDAAAWAGGGNEWASTAIYTSIMGIPEIAGFKAGSLVKGTRGAAVTRRGLERTDEGKLFDRPLVRAKEVTDRLGIRPVTQTLPSEIVGTAARMSSPVRAANMTRLQQAMIEAKTAQRANLDALREAALEKKAFIKTATAQEFGSAFNKTMRQKGYDLDKMPRVQEILDDLNNFDVIEGVDATIKARNVRDWVTVRNRVEKNLEELKDTPRLAEGSNQKVVLQALMRDMDDKLIQQFNDDLITGTKEAVTDWKDYNQGRALYNKAFHEDKIITDMIEKEVGPEQLKRWLIGANAANAHGKMSSTMKRIKEILGPQHPAIKGVQTDFMYDIMKPLFDSRGPNFDLTIRNLDNLIDGRPELLEALDLNKSDLKGMRSLAVISKRHPPSQAIKLVKDWAQLIARMGPWAHAISKAGMRVSFMGNLFRKLAGETPVQQRAVLAELAQAQFGGPMIGKGSIAAGRAIQGAFLADFQEIMETERERATLESE